VHPGHARKMAKKMIDQGHKVIYYENIEGGHSAAANLKQSAYMSTLQLEYLRDKLID
jgi:prolyl oligopeptidase